MLLDIQGDMNAIKNTMNELKKLSGEEIAQKKRQERYKEWKNLKERLSKGFDCPDSENCFSCPSHSTECKNKIVYSKRRYRKWKKQKEKNQKDMRYEENRCVSKV